MTKKIFLSMADTLYEALRKKSEEHGYMTIQELINETMRKSLFNNKQHKHQTKKMAYEDLFSIPIKRKRRK